MINLGKFHHPSIQGFHYINTPADVRQFKMHVHEGMELLFVISGSGRCLVEGVSYPIQPGDIFITQMAEVHVAEIQFEAQNYERVVIQFDPECLRETLNTHLLAPFLQRENGTLNRYTKAEISTEYIRSCTDRMFRVCQKGQASVISYLLPILQELYNAWENKRNTNDSASYSLATKVVAYVNKHLFDLSGMEQLEKDLFLSRTHINRIFHSVTGSTVWNYVRIKRLYAAREMLQKGIPATTVSLSCGYQDYSTFYRAYKKQFGHSPQTDCNLSGKKEIKKSGII